MPRSPVGGGGTEVGDKDKEERKRRGRSAEPRPAAQPMSSSKEYLVI